MDHCVGGLFVLVVLCGLRVFYVRFVGCCSCNIGRIFSIFFVANICEKEDNQTDYGFDPMVDVVEVLMAAEVEFAFGD